LISIHSGFQTAPIWGYCGQQGPPVHCQKGMVFSINAVETGPNNFAAFQQFAMRSGDATGAAAGGASGSVSGSAAGPTHSTDAAVGNARVNAALLVLGAIGAVSALL
jgi:hypothetical protein